MKPGALIDRINAGPFKPFRLRLSNGSTIDVPYPRMVVGFERAVVATEFRLDECGRPYAHDYRTLPLSEIEAILDA